MVGEVTKPEVRNGNEHGAAYGMLAPFGEVRDVFERTFERLLGGLPTMWDEAHPGWRWAVNVEDHEADVTVRAEVPGFDIADLDIELLGNQLIVRGAKKEEKKKNGKDVTAREYYRAVALPPGIDPENAGAKYENGVLIVKLPKTEEVRGRKIAIKG